MDQTESLLKFPPRPASEFEWEDLLVRIETMPRALGIAMEDTSPDGPGLRSLIDELVDRETHASRFLEAAAARAEGWTADPAPVPGNAERDGPRRFERIRARNFAIVQRRGIAVWEWRAVPGEDGPTVYQLMEYLAESDVETLARIRAATRGSGAC
jgi:hypothetical protein